MRFAESMFAMILLAAVVCSPVACVMHSDYRMAEAIKAGADPMMARCAFMQGSGNSTDCAEKVLRAKRP